MMFRINLATKIYVNARLVKLYSTVAVLLLSAFLVYNCISIIGRYSEIDRLNHQISATDEKLKTGTKSISDKQYKTLMTRINFANSVIEKKVYNWIALFDRLEQVTPEGVVFLSIEPDTKNQSLKLSGIARNFKHLRNFMEHLEESPYFTELYLTNQGETRLLDKSQALSFVLTCKVSLK